MRKRYGNPDSHAFFKNFSTILCKINVLDILNIVDVFEIFVASQSTKIVIESNFWLTYKASLTSTLANKAMD